MKKILSIVFSIFMLTVYASAYTIDGDLSDWGVTPFSDWIPGSDTCDWIVEDNIDPARTGDPAYPDWTGYSATGVHIQGTGSSSSTYSEPVLNLVDSWSAAHGGHYLQPAGGEHYDIEALYFDDDAFYAYFAIVTSMDSSGYTDQYGRHCDPGDLALDLDNNGVYEYGIYLYGANQGKICLNPTWSTPGSFPSSYPDGIASCNNHVGNATVVYTSAGVSDNSVSNYIVEVRAPKTALGEPIYGQISDLHITMTCGNDIIELLEYTWNFQVPESAVAVALVSLLIPGLIYVARKRE
ncbi:MAG: hypothetical protein JW778_01830 [Candidatus Altiarchaeota archaeon]|nr:hypothetical protein [Candidatus Altiarchaeota archaeon]